MTRLYLHVDGSAEPGTLPTTTQSATFTSTTDWESQTVNRTMNTTIGNGQTSLTLVRAATSSADPQFYISKFISPELNMTAIAANTWDWNFAVKTTNTTNTKDFPSNVNNDRIPVCCYVWRPGTGTKVGNIRDNTTAASYYDVGNNTDQVASVFESAEVGTFTGASVAGVQTGDVIVLEAWVYIDTSNSNSTTYSFFYDGGTINNTPPGGPTVTDHAAYLETPETLTFVAAAAGAARPYHSFTDTGFWPAVGARTF